MLEAAATYLAVVNPSGEQDLAEHLARSIEPGMLVLADRNVLSPAASSSCT
jgi:hypothetical protein